MKRYIYIIIGIIVAAAIAILILFLLKGRLGNSTPGITGNTTSTGSLPVAGTQGSNGTGTGSSTTPLGLSPIAGSSTPAASSQMSVQNFGVLSSDPVLDYFIDTKNNVTAIEPTGAIFTISNGQSAVINSSTINAIISASFSYDGKMTLVSYGTATDPQAAIFNVSTGVWTGLPQGMLSPQWSPANNYQIAYLAATGNGKLALATINAANLKAGPVTLLSLNANDVALQWPTQSEFILSDKPTAENAGSVWVFNSATNTLTPLIYEVPGAEGIWSHNASIPYGLTFFANPSGQGDTLQLQAITGNLPTEALNFLTLPSKCAFNTELMPISAPSSPTTGTPTSTASSATAKKAVPVIAAATSTPYLALYCGVPRSSSGFSSAQLPDAYNTMALFTSDDIYKINTATGADQVLWSDATENMDASDMKFFNNALFFINRYDSKLYGLTFN
jgi:hypothetical protein